MVLEYLKANCYDYYMSYLKNKHDLSFRNYNHIIIDLLKALNYLQKKTNLENKYILHRDLKPTNILVAGSKNLIKLADFGSSIWHNDEKARNEDCN